MDTITVVGAGTMGHGIAHVFLLTNSKKVVLNDISQKVLEDAEQKIQRYMKKLGEKNYFNDVETPKKFLDKLHLEHNLTKSIENSDFIIEVVPEDISIKKETLQLIGREAPERTIIASNTSTFTITELGLATGRPEQTVGMHFFLPPFNQCCVEIMKANDTDNDVFRKVISIGKQLPCRYGKRLVAAIKKDSPGFIANRLLIAGNVYINLLADKAVEAGIPFEQMDADVREMMNIGPFELCDYLGLDTTYKSLKSFEKRISPDFAPGKVITSLVSSGNLGKKTGQGFYEWDENGKVVINKSKKSGLFNLEILLAIQLNEGCKLLEEGVVSSYRLIDNVMKKGTGFPGPFLPGKANYKKWSNMLEEFAAKNQLDYFLPCSLMTSGKFVEMR